MHLTGRSSIYECRANVWEIIVDRCVIPDGSQLLLLPEMQRASSAPTNNRQGLTGPGRKEYVIRIWRPADGRPPRRCISISFYLFIHINFPSTVSSGMSGRKRIRTFAPPRHLTPFPPKSTVVGLCSPGPNRDTNINLDCDHHINNPNFNRKL